jgi:PAS domain S-box-containing protein
VESELARITLNSIGDGVICTDVTGNITYLNPVAESMTGWSREEACGRRLPEVLRIIDGDSRETVLDPLAMAIRRNEAVGLSANCVLIRRDGYESAIEDSSAPIHDGSGQLVGAVLVFRDVSGARAMSVRMSYLAQHDFLTGLPNRLLLNDRLLQAIAAAGRHGTCLAVLFVDVDYFKRVNDSLGHTTGDGLLKSIALRLVACVRTTDTVSRHGGDEFIVLLSEVTRWGTHSSSWHKRSAGTSETDRALHAGTLHRRKERYSPAPSYIFIPPIPPRGIPPSACGSSFGASPIITSVVSNRPATEAAFCSASRVTFVGSRMPSSSMSANSPVAAL